MIIRNDCLKDQVYDHLVKKVRTNSLKAEEKVHELNICKDLGVSRTPVREALVELAKEGYLERIPRRGFRIRKLSVGEIREAYLIIGCLEGFASRSAVSKLSESDFQSLSDLIAKMEECIQKREHDKYFIHQNMFHEIFVKASGNQKLHELITSLKSRYVRQLHFKYPNKEALFQVLGKTNDEHRKILKLLKARKADELEVLLRNVHWNIVAFGHTAD